MEHKCNCGKPGRYSLLPRDGSSSLELSCNKYARCLTYEELLEDRDRLKSKTVVKCLVVGQGIHNVEQYVYLEKRPNVGWVDASGRIYGSDWKIEEVK
ncbi:conserved hypothetical protein [Vibrio phage 150E35-1]|nr:conserved hypothetical protein [Vibrio phage 150E35-1]